MLLIQISPFYFVYMYIQYIDVYICINMGRSNRTKKKRKISERRLNCYYYYYYFFFLLSFVNYYDTDGCYGREEHSSSDGE